MQTELAGRADVHCRTLADGFHTAKNFDGVGSVITVAIGKGFAVFRFSFEDLWIDFFRCHSELGRTRRTGGAHVFGVPKT